MAGFGSRIANRPPAGVASRRGIARRSAFARGAPVLPRICALDAGGPRARQSAPATDRPPRRRLSMRATTSPLVTVLLLAVVPAANGRTIVVNPSDSIQAAVD